MNVFNVLHVLISLFSYSTMLRLLHRYISFLYVSLHDLLTKSLSLALTLTMSLSPALTKSLFETLNRILSKLKGVTAKLSQERKNSLQNTRHFSVPAESLYESVRLGWIEGKSVNSRSCECALWKHLLKAWDWSSEKLGLKKIHFLRDKNVQA